jgi:ATP-binding cassette, subfamily B, bacterial MsbA
MTKPKLRLRAPDLKPGLKAVTGRVKSLARPRLGSLRDDLSIFYRLAREMARPYAWHYAAALAMMAVVAGATGLSAWMMRDLINKVFIDKDVDWMIGLSIAIVGVFVAKGFANYGQEVILARIGNRLIAEIQSRIFRHLLRQDIAFFQQTSSSDLVTRIAMNAQAASTGLNLIATSIGRDMLTVLSLIAVMASQDWLLTLIALIGVPLVFVGLGRLLKMVRKLFSSEMLSIASIIATLQETSHAIRIIRSFRLDDAMQERMDASVQAVERLSNRMVAAQAATNPLLDSLAGIAVASIVIYGGWQVIAYNATPGGFFAFITALLLLTDPARRLARLRLSLATSAFGTRMLYDLLDQQPTIVDAPDARPLRIGAGEIVLENVEFAYTPDEPVLRGLDLVAEGGRTTALVGLSGAGKSTIFNLVLRFYDVRKGSVSIDGQDVRAVTRPSLYDQVTLVSQDVFLFSGSIAENILRGRPGATRAEMEQAARDASAHDFILQMPRGYDTDVGEFGARLSGGQRQRVALARAFLKNAPILLLDEPTSALDSEADAAIGEALTRLARGRTTLIIAHRLATVVNADCIQVVEAGRVVESGSHAELMAKDGRYRELFTLQFKHSST